MAGSAGLRIERPRNGGEPARAILTFEDDRYSGQSGSVTRRTRVDVTRGGGEDASEQRLLQDFKVTGRETAFEIPAGACDRYGYRGASIAIESTLRVDIDGKTVLEAPLDELCDPRIGKRGQSGDAASLVEPPDRFSILDNLGALAPQHRMAAIALMLLGGIVVGVNSLVGFHDQFVPESRTWVYDQRGSDGSESPLMKSLAGSGAAGVALWFALRRQLRRYMNFSLATRIETPRRGTRIPARDLVRGKSRVALEQVRVRVVAANRELGKYTEKSGTSTRTVTFKDPVHAVVLYDAFLPHVPARMPLESYLTGEVDFTPMFSGLYPPLPVGADHGIDLVWEAQLLHPKFIDQEAAGPTTGLHFADFLDA